MHTVTPVVARVGRYVDLFVLWVVTPDIAVDRPPILQWQYAEQPGRGEMACDNLVAYPWLGIIGGETRLAEYVVEETLCFATVFFPLLAYAAHVVSGGCADRVVWIAPGVAEF